MILGKRAKEETFSVSIFKWQMKWNEPVKDNEEKQYEEFDENQEKKKYGAANITRIKTKKIDGQWKYMAHSNFNSKDFSVTRLFIKYINMYIWRRLEHVYWLMERLSSLGEIEKVRLASSLLQKGHRNEILTEVTKAIALLEWTVAENLIRCMSDH